MFEDMLLDLWNATFSSPSSSPSSPPVSAGAFVVIACYAILQFFRLAMNASDHVDRMTRWSKANVERILREPSSEQRAEIGQVLVVQKRVAVARVDTPQELLDLPTQLPARGAIGLLPAIGLLGTFLGVVQGLKSLQGIDLSSADEASVRTLLRGAMGLLDGMAVAFTSTVWALLFYFLLLGFHAWFVWLARRRTTQAHASFVQNFPLRSPLHALANLDAEAFRLASEKMDETATAMSASAESLGESTEEFTQAASALKENADALKHAATALSSEGIGKAVGKVLERAIQDHIVPLYLDLLSQSAAQKELVTELRGVAQQQLACLTRLETGTLVEFEKVLQAQLGEAERLREQVERLHPQFAKLQNQLRLHGESTDALVRAVQSDLTSAARSLRNAMEEFETTSKSAADSFAQKWETSVTEGLEKLSDTIGKLDNIDTRYQSASQQLLTTLKQFDAQARTMDASIGQARQMVAEMGKSSLRLQEAVDALPGALTWAMTQVTDRALAINEKQMASIADALVDVTEQLSEAASEARELARAPRTAESRGARS